MAPTCAFKLAMMLATASADRRYGTCLLVSFSHYRNKESCFMECFIVIVILLCVALASWAFRAGKREGSRKGYGVGRQHARRKQYRRR